MCKKEKLKISLFNKNIENPFLNKAIEKIESNIIKKYKSATKTGEKAILKAYDENTGEVLGHTQFIRQIEVDETKFSKLYLSNFSAFFDLKSSSIKVFGYILNTLIPNKDYFYFNREDCLKYTGYKSDTSVFKGLAELLNSEIIARGKRDYIYFINPLIFFNGNRITFSKTYIKKKKEEVSKKLPTENPYTNPNQINIFDQIKENK
jgi:hypothetical protein